MGPSYVKIAGRPEMKEIPLDPVNLWEYARELHQDFGDLVNRIPELENELWDLHKRYHYTSPTSIRQKVPDGYSSHVNPDQATVCCRKDGN